MSHDNSSTSCCTLCNFFCSLPSAPSHLSLFLIFSLLALSSHLSCLHLSFCRLFSRFFSLFTFFSLIAAPFILCSVLFIVSLFSLFTSPILPPFLLFLSPYSSPPPCQISSLCPCLSTYYLSLFALFIYLLIILSSSLFLSLFAWQ